MSFVKHLSSDITRFFLPDIVGCPVLIFRLGVLNFPKNESQITDAYSEACETSKMEFLTKNVNDF